MPGAFLWDERVARAVALSAIGVQPVASLPLSNLLDAQPRHRARWLGSAASVLADFGADTAIDAVALLSTTLGATDTVRWRLGALEGLVEAAPVFDLRFTSPGTLAYPAGWAFTRNSLGWQFNEAGILVETAANVPRFDYSPSTLACRGLLLEESRTNGIRNPRAEGATPGSPGTMPTNWFTAVSGSGVASSVVGTGVESGIPYCDVRFSGTASGTVATGIYFDALTAIAAASGQTWTGSGFVRLVAGSFGTPLESPRWLILEYNASSVALANTALVFSPAPSASGLATQRFSVTRTLTQATTAHAVLQFYASFSSGAVVDFTIRIGAPQTEQGNCASSVILPPIATPGATLRQPDITRITGLSIAAATLLVQCQVITSAASAIAGYGPNNSFVNSSYFTIDASGTCTWHVIGGPSPASIGGSVNAAVTLVGAASATGKSFVRNAAQTLNVAAFALPAAMDRVSLGGAPWGAPPGTASGIGTYQRLALYGSRLLDTQTLQLGATGSSLVPAAVAHDSGVLAASTDAASQGNVVLLRSSAATGRYLLVDATAPAAALIDIGRLVAGPLWRVSRAVAYGVQEGRETLDRRDRNPLTGAEFPVPALVNPRVARFALPLLSSAEIRAQHRLMMAALGGAGEALWIPETTLALAEMNARSLWGAIAMPGEESMSVRDTPAGNARTFRIVERT